MKHQKQHYVPKVYLKQFSKNLSGNFFRTGLNPKFHNSIKSKNVSEVCFLDNFYTLNKDDTLKKYELPDKNFIEKSGFRYENHLITQIINKFKNKNAYIYKSIHENLVDIYLNIKQRGILYRKDYTGQKGKESLNKILTKEIDINKALWKSYFGEMVNDEMFEKIKNDIILDSERHEEFHKTALVTSAKGINSNVEETKRVLLKMNIYLFEPKYHNDYFITSDNPGFSLLKGKVFNTNFGDFDSVGFPINSKQFIFFHGKSVQSEFEIRRAINYQKATSKEVDQFNYYTMQNSFEYVFCESKSYLKYITEKLHEGL